MLTLLFYTEAVKRCDFFLSVFSLEWPFPINCDNYLDDNDPNVCVGYKENQLLESKTRSEYIII